MVTQADRGVWVDRGCAVNLAVLGVGLLYRPLVGLRDQRVQAFLASSGWNPLQACQEKPWPIVVTKPKNLNGQLRPRLGNALEMPREEGKKKTLVGEVAGVKSLRFSTIPSYNRRSRK